MAACPHCNHQFKQSAGYSLLRGRICPSCGQGDNELLRPHGLDQTKSQEWINDMINLRTRFGFITV